MKINEIFYSLQGEGFFTGTPAVFVRLSGCNLQCPFCDTAHQSGTDMTEAAIIEQVCMYPARHVVITGGEPSLQLTSSLIDGLHRMGKFVAVETNGTGLLPPEVDWVTLSPKDFTDQAASRIALARCNEMKLLFTGLPLPDYPGIQAEHYFLQPCDTGNTQENTKLLQQTIHYCMEHPQWRLSLQTHKLTGIR